MTKKLVIIAGLLIFLLAEVWGQTFEWTGDTVTAGDWTYQDGWFNHDMDDYGYGYPSSYDHIAIISGGTVSLYSPITIDSIYVYAAANVNINADITTAGSGGQIFNGQVTLGGAGVRTLTSTAGPVRSLGAASGLQELIVNASTGIQMDNTGNDLAGPVTLINNDSGSIVFANNSASPMVISAVNHASDVAGAAIAITAGSISVAGAGEIRAASGDIHFYLDDVGAAATGLPFLGQTFVTDAAIFIGTRTAGWHIAYSPANPNIANAVWVNSGVSIPGNPPLVLTTQDNGNIYIADVGATDRNLRAVNGVPGAGGSGSGYIEIRGTYTSTAVPDAAFPSTPLWLQSGSGGVRFDNNAAVTMQNAPFIINAQVNQSSRNVTLAGSDTTITATSISIDATIHGVTPNANSLALTSPGTVNITIAGGAGSSAIPLGDITVDNGGTATFSGGAMYANSFVQDGSGSNVISADIHVRGNLSFASTLTLAGNVTLNSNFDNGNGEINLQMVNYSAAGSFTLQSGSGRINLNAPVFVNGDFTQYGTGDIYVHGNITTDGNISTASRVVLQNALLVFSAGSGDIIFNGEVGGANQLTFGAENESGVVRVYAPIQVPLLVFDGGPNQRITTAGAANLVNVRINSGTTLSLTGGAAQVNGATLDIRGTLNATGHSWRIGGAPPPPATFIINQGYLVFAPGGELRATNFTVPDHTPMFSITFDAPTSIWAAGDVSIGDNVNRGAAFLTPNDHDLHIFTLVMNGQTGELTVGNNSAIGSLRLTGANTNAAITSDIQIRGNVLIEGGATLRAGRTTTDNITIHVAGYYDGGAVTRETRGGARWFQTASLGTETGAGGVFVPNNSAVEFGERGLVRAGSAGRTFRIAGNTTWHILASHEPRADILFSNYPHRHTIRGGFTIEPLDIMGARDTTREHKIMLSRLIDRGLIPSHPGAQVRPPYAANPDFWYLQLEHGVTLTLDQVFLTYSYSHRRIPLPLYDTDRVVVANPYFNDKNPNDLGNPRVYANYRDFSFFNVNWISANRFFYSFTEDSTRNGRIDRIRAQAAFALNGDFSGFDVEVAGYTIDRSRGQNGFDLVSNATPVHTPHNSDMIFIYLVERPYADGGARLRWRITRNDSLMDDNNNIFIGNYGTGWYLTYDTVPPRISYTFALPDHNEIFLRMSKPIDPGITSPDGDVQGIPGGAFTQFLIETSGNFTLADIAKGQPFQIDNVADGAPFVRDLWSIPPADYQPFMFPSPKFPVDWEYSDYVEIRGWFERPGSPNNRGFSTYSPAGNVPLPGIRDWYTGANTPRMGNLISGAQHGMSAADYGSGQHRVSDLLISIPPSALADPLQHNRFFVWPLWARPEDPQVSFDNLLGWENNNHLQHRAHGAMVWDFTGRRQVEQGNITMQSRLSDNIDVSGVGLVLAFDVPSESKSGNRHSSAGLWLPDIPAPRIDMAPRFQSTYHPVLQYRSPRLYNHRFHETNTPQRNTAVEFFYQLSGSVNGVAISENLLAGRLDITPGADVPGDWFRRIRPFSVDIHGITRQRGGVTILNNVINSDRRERTYLDFRMIRPGRVSIQVFTLDGTLVRNIEQGNRPASGQGFHRVSWDGTNRSGRPVARGMYFIRVVAPEIDEIRKVMVVR